MNIVIGYVLGVFAGYALHDYINPPVREPVPVTTRDDSEAERWHHANADGDLHGFAPTFRDCLDCRFLNPHVRGVTNERTR